MRLFIYCFCLELASNVIINRPAETRMRNSLVSQYLWRTEKIGQKTCLLSSLNNVFGRL